MEQDILVSISCTTYNHAQYIRQCLDGFLMQECNFQYEVLIHDDASTDGTIDIIKEYQEKYPDIIKPYIQKENQWSKGVRGMNAKYNYSRAKGKYIAMCEGDDYWTDPLKLQKQVDFLEENEDFVACQHNRTILNNQNSQSLEVSKSYVFTQCLVFRNIIDQYYIDFTSQHKIFNGDTFLEYFLKANGKYKHLDFTGAVYRFNGFGIYSQLNEVDKNINGLNSYQRIFEFVSNSNYKNKKLILSFVKRKILHLYLSLIYQKIENFNKINLIKLYFKYKIFDLKSIKSLLSILIK